MENQILDETLTKEQKSLEEMELAGHWRRFANLIIDGIIVSLLQTVLDTILLPSLPLFGESVATTIFVFIIYLSLNFLYYTIMEATTAGKTIGKYITKTKVLNADGEQPALKTIMIRSVARYIPFEAFSFLGKKARGWHDTLSKTYVVRG